MFAISPCGLRYKSFDLMLRLFPALVLRSQDVAVVQSIMDFIHFCRRPRRFNADFAIPA